MKGLTTLFCINQSLDGHLKYKRGDVIAGRYVIEKTLGEGTFGKVAKCQDRKKKCTVALKIIKNIERSYTTKCNFVVIAIFDHFMQMSKKSKKWSKMVKLLQRVEYKLQVSRCGEIGD